MKIRETSKMINEMRELIGGSAYSTYKYLKAEYIKHEDKHPNFCGFVAIYYYTQNLCEYSDLYTAYVIEGII